MAYSPKIYSFMNKSCKMFFFYKSDGSIANKMNRKDNIKCKKNLSQDKMTMLLFSP